MIVKIACCPGPLQVERMPGGRRHLLRALLIRLDEEHMLVRESFKTHYSYWPRYPTFLLGLALIGMLICRVPKIIGIVTTALMPASVSPRFSKTDVAGVVHDFIWQHATLVSGGHPVGYLEGNKIWYWVARSGSHPRARASRLEAAIGFTGLTLFASTTWCRYRRAEKSES